MGAESFYTESEGSTVQESFKKAVEQAQWDYGHSGYTGTIAEKYEGFIIIPDSEWKGKYEPSWYARKLIRDGDARIDDKWGPAGAIELDINKWGFFGWASS